MPRSSAGSQNATGALDLDKDCHANVAGDPNFLTAQPALQAKLLSKAKLRSECLCRGTPFSSMFQCAKGGGAARGGESQSSRPHLTTRGCQCLGFVPHSQLRQKPPAKKPTFWLWWLRLRLLLLLFKLFLPFGF